MAPAAPAAPQESWWLPARVSLPQTEQGLRGGSPWQPKDLLLSPWPCVPPGAAAGECPGLGSVTHPPQAVPGCAVLSPRTGTRCLWLGLRRGKHGESSSRGMPGFVCDPSRSLSSSTEIPWATRASSHPGDTATPARPQLRAQHLSHTCPDFHSSARSSARPWDPTAPPAKLLSGVQMFVPTLYRTRSGEGNGNPGIQGGLYP